MAWAAEQTTGSPTRKAVLLALANDANTKTGLCCPDIPTISYSTELSEKTVKRALVDLVAAGFISRTRKRRDDGTLSRYFYTFSQGTLTTSPGDSVSSDQGSESPHKNQEQSSNQETFEAAPRRAPSGRPRNIVWDALVEVMGFEPKDGDGKTDFGKTVGQLRRLIPSEATFDECVQAMRVRRARFEQRFEGATFTHRVLRGRWDELGVQGGQASRVPAQSDFSGDSFGRELEDDGTGQRTF